MWRRPGLLPGHGTSLRVYSVQRKSFSVRHNRWGTGDGAAQEWVSQTRSSWTTSIEVTVKIRSIEPRRPSWSGGRMTQKLTLSRVALEPSWEGPRPGSYPRRMLRSILPAVAC